MTEEVNSLIFEILLHIMKDASATQAIEFSISVHLIQTHKPHSEAGWVSKALSLASTGYFQAGEKVSAHQKFLCVRHHHN